MAKKSTSVSKKTAKVASKSSAKKATPAAKKVVVKPAQKKPEKKPNKKLEKKPAKIVKKPSVPVKAASKKADIKSLEVKAKSKTLTPVSKKEEKVSAAQPAMMTKKGKSAPEVENETHDIEASSVDAAPQKAEKASKVKPIRIEKGNTEDEKAKWAELFKKYGKENAIPYKMSDSFPNLSPLQHKVLGWGFILKNDNDRLEVLFETGIRMLISNYKS